MLKKIKDYEKMNIEDLILLLSENDYTLVSWLYDLATDPDNVWMIQALAKIGIMGNDIKKIINYSCKNNLPTIKITLEMLASEAYFDKEIASNLDREKPFPFFDGEIESPEMLEALAYGMIPTDSIVYEDFCHRQRSNFIYKYGTPESGEPILVPWTVSKGRNR